MTRANVFVVVIAGLVLAMIGVMALNNARENSRKVFCLERMMNLGFATLGYEQAHGHLPPGTLGIKQSPDPGEWRTPASPFSWQTVQNFSSLPLVASYYKDSLPSVNIPPEALQVQTVLETGVTWQDFIENLSQEGSVFRREAAFSCPADSFETSDSNLQMAMATQPVWSTKISEDLETVFWSPADGQIPASTNYLGNAGVSGGCCDQPEDALSNWIGPLRSRSKTKIDEIIDGKSVTFLYGENIGQIRDGQRTQRHSWLLGGLAIARPPFFPSDCLTPEILKTQPLLGNFRRSELCGFASRHVDGVNFVFVGGETTTISRRVDPMILFSQAGTRDSRY